MESPPGHAGCTPPEVCPTVRIVQFVAESLGDASYLVVSGNVAAMVDPQRDIRPYLKSANEQGAEIRFVFETHVHNDYLSGGRELAALGARVVAPASSGLEFPHLPVSDGDEVEVGGCKLRAVAAPGHTYEHTAYLAVNESGEVQGAFTGGALLMAAAGRSDLLGPDHSEELTRLQWETAHRLATLLPKTADLMPTHGAGSFCSGSGACEDRRGPLSLEMERNPALASPSFELFRSLHLSARAPIPDYYRHMAPINRAGPTVYGTPPVPPELDPTGLRALMAQQVPVVDVRTRLDFAAAHIPASLDIEDSGSLLAYASWLLPFNSPLALVSYDRQQAERITADLFRIGYESVNGFLNFTRWTEAGGATASLPVVDVATARSILQRGLSPVADVRFSYEQDALPLPGAARLPMEEFSEWSGTLGRGPVLIVCASGQRAVMMASALRVRGVEASALATGGAADLV